jgi:hypothetical protein
MRMTLAATVIAIGVLAGLPAQAHNDPSDISTLSVLPIASVVVGASAVVGGVVAVPVILSTAGAVLVVKAVEVTARGMVYTLERASDGARASVEIVGAGVGAASLAAGTVVTVSVVGAGVVLSAAGEAIAFLPNTLGRALLYNERLTY